MNVYFDENFWGCGSGPHKEAPGEPVHVDAQLWWEERKVRIPAVYVCEQGLTVDFCVRIPVEDIEYFGQKWMPLADGLTEEEQLDRENPFSCDWNVLLDINGRRAENRSGCAVSWMPPALRADEARGPETDEAVDEILMESYGCSRRDGWKFFRRSYAWPGGEKEPVRTLDFGFEKNPDYYPGPRFTTRLGEEKKQVEFCHPVSKKRHMLTVRELEQAVLPERDVLEPKLMGMRFEKIPAHFLVIKYTVEPALPEGELRLCDCGKADPPVMSGKRAAGVSVIGGAAGPVSVIGGAAGPVSVFLAGRNRTERQDWQSACSSVHYGPVDRVEWRMDFHVKSREKKKIEIVL